MQTKICTKCKIEKDINEFRMRDSKKGSRQPWCKLCFSEYEKKIWRDNNVVSRLRKIKNVKAIRNRNSDFVIDFLKHSCCKDCGEKDIVVLEFDHLGNKSFEISFATRGGYGLNRIKKEIEKCDVVCANCHKRRTAKTFGWKKSLIGV